jgi:hypothetical protein
MWEVMEIKTVPYVPAVASLCGAAGWNPKKRVPGSNVILHKRRPFRSFARRDLTWLVHENGIANKTGAKGRYEDA